MNRNRMRNKLACLKVKAEKASYAKKDWRFFFRKFYKESINYFEGGLSISNPEKIGLIEITDKPRFINGWYADNWQDSIYMPVVFICRSKDSNKLWVFCGYHDKDADCYILEKPYLDSYDVSDSQYSNFLTLDGFDYTRAWRYADSFAESQAEKSRDFYAQDQAERDIEEEKERIHELNKSALELIKEIKGKQYPAPICDAIKARMVDILAERKSAFEIIKLRMYNYWSAVS